MQPQLILALAVATLISVPGTKPLNGSVRMSWTMITVTDFSLRIDAVEIERTDSGDGDPSVGRDVGVDCVVPGDGQRSEAGASTADRVGRSRRG